MRIYTKYIIYNLLYPFLAICAVLTAIIWLTQVLKLIYLIDRGVRLITFFHITMLTIPSLLMIIMPVSLFCASLWLFNKLKMERELVILENSGLNFYQICKPVIYLSLLVTFFAYIISLYLLPKSYSMLRSKLEKLKNSYAISLIEEKIFNPLSKNIILYVDKKHASGALERLILFDKRKAGHTVIFFASKGRFYIDHGVPRFYLINGNRQAVDKNNNMKTLNFKELEVDFTPFETPHKIRNRDTQEKYIMELFNPEEGMDFIKASKHRAEGHQRIIWPLMNLVLPVFGVAIFLYGPYRRRGNLKFIALSAASCLCVVVFNFSFSNLSVKTPYLDYLIYTNLLITILVTAILLRRNKV